MTHIKKITIQIILSSLWFVGMAMVYKYPFIQYQFIDSHFKRVASSIEQHFGQRTFYFDVLFDQLKILLIPALGSLIYFTVIFFKKKTNRYMILLSVFFVPWFVFLNLTKTKIAWYIYPILPQFAFLSVYPFLFLKKRPIFLFFTALCILLVFFSTITPISTLLTNSFSRLEDHHLIAQDAKKNKCNNLYVLVGETTRSSYKTLKSMNLVISTTTWWGNHPSIAYYADTKTTYLYDVKEAINTLSQLKNNSCMIIEKKDLSVFSYIKNPPIMSVNNNTYLLFK